MSQRIEWRRRSEGDDVLLAIEDDTNTVVQSWQAEPGLLKDFLNDMDDIKARKGDRAEVVLVEPEDWGNLVLARSADGDVVFVEPQLYWEGVAYWFRSHGRDPHPWRRN
jgi:hypothetical protein